jgi:hypothetical protein
MRRTQQESLMLTPASRLQDLVRRIQMEYIEMPGLALTRGQARRLWNLDAEVCDQVLATLVAEEFLGQTSRGAFLRRELCPSNR